MPTTLNRLSSPVRSLAAGTWLSLLAVLTLSFCAVSASASAAPPIVVSGTPVQLGALTGGGWDGSQEPVGGTFVVGVNGNVLVGTGYSSNYLQLTLAGSNTTLAAGVGGSAATLDSYGNLYFGGNYNANIYKVPYDAATGAYVGWTGSAPTTNCLGGNQDTAACVFAPAVSTFVGSLGGSAGFAGVGFDAAGNFFFETNTLPGTTPNSIFECNIACISNSSATPALLYADAKPVGAMQLDPWGNIFFVDGSNSSAGVTNLKELPLSSGTYASSPTVVLSYTNAAGYSNGISGMAISGTGTIFFSTNADGIFAIPNTLAGGPQVSEMYMVSAQGGKGIALDSAGNLYGIPYSGGDVVSYIPVNNFSLGSKAVGAAATTVNATIFDSSGACTPTVTATATQFGVTSAEFMATASATCSTAFGGTGGTFSSGPLTAAGFSSFPVTLDFTPSAAGTRNAALVLADSTSGASGVAALTGVGQGAIANLDPGVWSTFTSQLTSPASVAVDAAGDIFVADPGAGKIFEFAKGSTTPTAIGSGFTAPTAVAFDAAGNLFVADTGSVYQISNTGATGAFAAGTQSTLIGTTMKFDGTALAVTGPAGLVVGPSGTLYISDTDNKRVVNYSLVNGVGGVTLATAANGLMGPAGIAVDASNNLYVADPGAAKVFVVSSGAVSSVSVSGVTMPVGVAVDASGSLLIADKTTGNIVRVPNNGSGLNTAKAITVEALTVQATSLALDSSGNLFATSGSGKKVYAIQRTAASVSLGAVQDGITNSATIYLMNAGNAAVALGTPAVTNVTNSMFSLVAASTNGCADGGSGPAGETCQFVATFAPAVGTPDQTAESGSATINFVGGTALVSMSGTATASAVQAQTITGFAPNTPLVVGQQIALTATGGGSGNPVTFTIDGASACLTCASISGSTLSALKPGTVTIDANQAAGANGGLQYAAATQVQATITINAATVAGVPGLVMSQVKWLAALTAGGFTSGANPSGGSFAVNSNGDAISGTAYGSTVVLINGKTGGSTDLAAISNPTGIAIDSQNNLYVSHNYNSVVLKVPYVSGSYVAFTDTSSAPACTGTDTAVCSFANAGVAVKAIGFDAAGNFYLVSVPDSTTSANKIYECDSTCLPAGTATAIYSDTNAAVSQIAFDPWGNMFFTEGVYSDIGNLVSTHSNLYELPYTAGTGFAATPTLLQTMTVASPSNYDNQLDGVAVGADGTVYYATQNEGTFAIPNTQTGGPDLAHQYAVSKQGGKAITLDSAGNVWVASYSTAIASGGKDTIGKVLINNLTAPTAQYQGAPVTTTATVIDNVVPCSTAAVLAFTSTDSQFAATGGATCSPATANFSTPVSASSYTATITFTATKPGQQSATLTASDTANGGTATATISGLSQTTPQIIAFTAPTTTTFTYQPGLTIALAATGGGSNNPIVLTVDASSTGKGTISGNTLTVTQAGNIVIDANQVGGLVSGVYYSDAAQVQLTLTIGKSPEVITFTPPTSPLTYSPGMTVTLSATGSGSTSPVVFTVDSGSATTGAGTISGNTLTVTQAGTIILDANQVADINYQAAAQVQQVLVVNQATQTITITPVTVPLHYIGSCSSIMLCAQVQITATGGATNNAIALSPDSTNAVQFTILSSSTDKNGVTTSMVALIPNQTLTFPAKLVIDANQQGDSNYSAAKQASITISVLAALPLQTITWANPGTQVTGTPLTLNGVSSAGATFPIIYTSSTTSICTVNNTTAKATFLTSGACIITATQPGDNLTYAAAVPVTQTFAVNATGKVPTISLNLSLASITMQAGTVGLTQLTINSQNNFQGSIALSCTGLPAGYSCTFTPNPLVFTPDPNTGVPQTTTATTNLTISGGSASAAHQDQRPFLPMTTLAVALCFLGFRKRNRLQMLLLVVVSLVGLGLFSGCGGTSGATIKKGTSSNVTVTATSGTLTQSTTLTLIVQ